MNRYQLFKQLRKHRKLAEKRAMNFSQNKSAKWIVGFLSAFMILYLMFFAIIFATVANSSNSITSLEFMFGLAPFILIVDFLLRFSVQQTPSQLVKPYIMLPIGRYTCSDIFVLTSMLNTSNLIWMAMLVPYAFMAILFSFGIYSTLLFLLTCYLLIVANSQWYLICRTKIIDSQCWWALPIIVYALIFSPFYLGNNAGSSKFFNFYGHPGTLIEEHSLLPLFAAAAIVLLLFTINRRLQYAHIRTELIGHAAQTLHHTTQLKALDKYGEVGEYLKLEIKSIMRNKNPKKSFIASTVVVLIFSMLISFTDIYSGKFMGNFWCIYNYVIYGATMLSRIMCNEGNYIDALMVRKENLLTLLRAKYIFFTLLLLLPFLLMLPTVIFGEWTLLMLVAYAVFTAGFQYFILFQLAAYNKQTIPLNTKFLAKGSIENNYFQILVQLVAFFFPLLAISILQTCLNDTLAYITMLIIGIAFVATHKVWIKNIYKRMMRKRYENMAAFRASR